MSSSDQAAEADLIDQQHDIGDAEEDPEVPAAETLEEASEGDLLEQEQVVGSDEDLYPYGAGEE